VSVVPRYGPRPLLLGRLPLTDSPFGGSAQWRGERDSNPLAGLEVGAQALVARLLISSKTGGSRTHCSEDLRQAIHEVKIPFVNFSAEQAGMDSREMEKALCPGLLLWALEDLNLRPLPRQGRQAKPLTCIFAGQSGDVQSHEATGLRSSAVVFGGLVDQVLTAGNPPLSQSGGRSFSISPASCLLPVMSGSWSSIITTSGER
jgi:hypothetical protein